MTWSRAVGIAALSIASLACGEQAEEQDAGATPEPSADTSVSAEAADTLVMPDFPEPERGHIVARSAGPDTLDATWLGRAATCEDPPILEISGERPGLGILVLLHLPSDERVTSYPVTIIEQGAPEPPVAQVAVQSLVSTSGRGFQGSDGIVELHALDDQVSGRFAVTLREVTSSDLQKYAAVFDRIPIQALPDEQCKEIREAQAVVDSTVADSAQ